MPRFSKKMRKLPTQKKSSLMRTATPARTPTMWPRAYSAIDQTTAV